MSTPRTRDETQTPMIMPTQRTHSTLSSYHQKGVINKKTSFRHFVKILWACSKIAYLLSRMSMHWALPTPLLLQLALSVQPPIDTRTWRTCALSANGRYGAVPSRDRACSLTANGEERDMLSRPFQAQEEEDRGKEKEEEKRKGCLANMLGVWHNGIERFLNIFDIVSLGQRN